MTETAITERNFSGAVALPSRCATSVAPRHWAGVPRRFCARPTEDLVTITRILQIDCHTIELSDETFYSIKIIKLREHFVSF